MKMLLTDVSYLHSTLFSRGLARQIEFVNKSSENEVHVNLFVVESSFKIKLEKNDRLKVKIKQYIH